MNDQLFKALSIFIDAMRPFVVSFLTEQFKNEPWEGVFFSRLKPDKQSAWNKVARSFTEDSNRMLLVDYNNLPAFALSFKQELAADLGSPKDANNLINYFQELQDVRNKCNHYQPVDEEETERAFITMKFAAKLLGMSELVTEIEKIKSRKPQPAAEHQPAQQSEVVVINEYKNEDSPLPAWFTNVTPHYDIRYGSLDESVFAANLSEVAMGSGQEVYRTPATFFEKTYITAGLRNIANRVVRALNGEETDNRVISLQTGFGGGKTHTLISLYHIAKTGKSLLTSTYTRSILETNVTPEFDQAQVAVFTNNTTDVSQGRQIDEGFTIHTLWGEIAYQLGGVEGYNRIRQNDTDRIAPAAGLIKPILSKATPCLILIDELADYCSKASGIKVGGGTLSDQTIGFMQTLTEVISSIPRCLLIATLPASATEVAASEVGQQILTALESRIVRVGTSIKPVEDEEIFEVVRRRLFDSIDDNQVVEQVLNRYKNTYHNRRTDLPIYADRMDYINKMRKSYPFHPELIDMFRLKWGQDTRFQRTRGVLRLLASIVKDLWTRRGSLTGTQALIHTSDVQLSNLPTLTASITSLRGSQWETVIHADISGTSSNAYKIDNEDPNSNIGKYNLTQGIATTLLMASVGNLQNKGLTIEEIKLCTLKPNGFNHNDVNGALTKLEQVAHYLYSTSVGSRSYWFQSKPNINILINQAKGEVNQQDIFAEIINRLNTQVKSIQGKLKVLVNPTSDIPEQKSLTLIIAGPEYATNPTDIRTKARQYIEKIAINKGNTNRVYRNTIFYLVCSEVGLSSLKNKLLEYIACDKIQKEYSGQIEPEQRFDLDQRRKECDRLVNELLIKAYSIVLKHSAKQGLEKMEIREFSNDFANQLNTNLLNLLKEEEWLINRVGLNTLKDNNLFPTPETPVRVNDIYETFLRFDDKPMITGPNAVVESVQQYCFEGKFNVGSGEPNAFTRIYHEETPSYLNVEDTQYWLVDITVREKVVSTGNETPTIYATGGGSQVVNDPHVSAVDNKESTPDISESFKNFKTVTISGKVPVERWTDLFSGFVVPLKNNGLEIEVTFRAKSTNINPLNESTQIYKIIKESAQQLGLDLDEEL